MERTAGSTSSTDARAPASAPGGVTLGRVVGVHGLRGELRVRLLDDNDNHLRTLPSVLLGREEGDPKAVEVRVRAVGSGRRGEARLALEGVESREAAEALRGRLVMVRAEHLDPLAPGEYYQYELVGCRVEDGAGCEVGVVRGIWETGGPALLVIARGEREILIPAVRDFLREVDVVARRIVIDAPTELLEAWR
jgi:16S rRNA processing protein RimM